MHKLSPQDQDWMVNRLKVYEIKYIEIYNEVYDHMVTAIEQRRLEGDTRELSSIFQDIMYDDIGSYPGIERMTQQRIDTVQKLLRKAVKKEFISYFLSWRSVLALGIISCCTIALQKMGLESNYLFFLLILASFIPSIYLEIFERKNKISTRKSMIRGYMQHLAYLSTSFSNIFIFLTPLILTFFINMEGDLNDIRMQFLNYIGVPGFIVLSVFMASYTLALSKVIKMDYAKMVREVVV